MTPHTNSFYPAAKKVFGNSAVRWVVGTLGTILAGVFTVYLWPATSAWVASRVSEKDLEKVEEKVIQQEAEHAVDYKNLDLANTDDTGALSHGSQVQWLIVRLKRMQMREVQNTRRLICAEAKLRMPSTKSEPAKAACRGVQLRYDELIKEKKPPDEAARLAMEFVFGSD